MYGQGLHASITASLTARRAAQEHVAADRQGLKQAPVRMNKEERNKALDAVIAAVGIVAVLIVNVTYLGCA